MFPKKSNILVSRKFPEGSINKAVSVTQMEVEMSFASATCCPGFSIELIAVHNNEIVASVQQGYKLFRAMSLATGPKSALPTTDWTVRDADFKFDIKHSRAYCCKSNSYLLLWIEIIFKILWVRIDLTSATSDLLWQNVPQVWAGASC